MKTRLYFLDNLRTFTIFLVVVLHAGNVYQPTLEKVWIVTDPIKSETIGLIHLYLDIFVMYIIFFISGFFAPASLRKKTGWEFILSKIKRIMIPWFIAAITLIPLYKMIFLYSRGLPQEEWYSYFHIFQRAGANLETFADNPAQSWLWFLPVLFLFQGLYLILAKSKILSFTLSLRSAIALTFVISVIYCLAVTALHQRGWYHSVFLHFKKERLLVYFLAFLLGSLFYNHKSFEFKIKTKYLIISAVILTISLIIYSIIFLNSKHNLQTPESTNYLLNKKTDTVLFYSSMVLSMLGFLFVFIYSFRNHFNFSNILLNELSRNSYPLYILHVVILGFIAAYLLEINTYVIFKYIILIIFTFISTNIIITGYRQIKEKIFLRKAGQK